MCLIKPIPGLFAAIVISLVFLCGCATAAITFYPAQEYAETDAEPVYAEDVHVIMDDSEPTCDYYEIGTFIYDWARDGIMTSARMSIDGIREAASDKGASGIYKIEYMTGGMGETGAQAVAYRCR